MTRIDDDAAIDYLARLRDRASLELRAELARGWRNFDTDRYAEEIIGHLDPEGLYFPVSDRFELAALRKLGGRPRVQIVGHVHARRAAGRARPRPAHPSVAGLRPARVPMELAGRLPPPARRSASTPACRG